jgi:hypothetical protein
MFYQLKKKDAKVFRKCGVHWCLADDTMHKTWLDKCVKSGMVKKYTVVENSEVLSSGVVAGVALSDVVVEFADNVEELYQGYKRTIVNAQDRGVHIEYISGLDELRMGGWDGWGLDLGELQGDYLGEFVHAMSVIHNIKSKIRLQKENASC